MGWAYTTPGHSNEVIYLFFANLGKRGKQNLEQSEEINLLEATKKEAIEMTKSDKPCDMKTIAGILKAKELGLL